MNGNNFTGEGVYILAGFMHLCPCLKTLISIECGITSGDLKLLLDKLKSLPHSYFSELAVWFLNDNEIDDSGVSALMDDHPSMFPSLRYVDLMNNPVSGEMKERLLKELKGCQEV